MQKLRRAATGGLTSFDLRSKLGFANGEVAIQATEVPPEEGGLRCRHVGKRRLGLLDDRRLNELRHECGHAGW